MMMWRLAEVRVEIYDRVTTQWWSDTGWQPVRSFVLADVTQPVPGDATWEYVFDLDGLTPSSLAYWWTATAFDTSGNKAIRSTSDFKVVVGDVVAPSQVIGAPGSICGGVVAGDVVGYG